MASIDDAIFLMDDEVIHDTIKTPHSITSKTSITTKNKHNKHNKKEEPPMYLAKSPPIDIIKIKRLDNKGNTNDIIPSSPFVNNKLASLPDFN